MRALLFLFFFGGKFAATAQTRTDYAIFFYVTDFQPGIDDVPYTKGEAEDLADVLTKDYGFSCHFVHECKKEDITVALEEWNKKIQPEDQALFFFSMHGYYDPESFRGYLIPADGKPGAQNDYFKSWLSYDDLRTYLAPCKAGHVLVALDACYSGSFGIRSHKSVSDLKEEGEKKPKGSAVQLDCNTRINNALNLKGRQFITAGKTEQTTPQRSAFVQEILATLRTGYDNDGLVFFDDLAYRLHKLKNPEPEDGTFGAQHKAGGDFVFVRNGACVLKKDIIYVNDDTLNIEKNDPEELLWIVAKLHRNPQIYLIVYPNGKYAAEADNITELSNDILVGPYRPTKSLLRDMNENCFEITKNEGLLAMGMQKWQDAAMLFRAAKSCADADHPSRALMSALIAKCADKAGQMRIPINDGLLFISGGTFQMGCTREQKDCDNAETPAHRVTISDFFIGRFEVTQALWREIMGDNPSHFKDCNDCPVENVSWDDIQIFLKKLNMRYPGRNYRLPTEAEWEYAARQGGKDVLFGNGKNIANPDEMNFYSKVDDKTFYSIAGNYRDKTTPVGSFAPNALGLYDMSGNVREWCSDWFSRDYYNNSPAQNPENKTQGVERVIRGGSWGLDSLNCRVTNRFSDAPGGYSDDYGLRLARSR